MFKLFRKRKIWLPTWPMLLILFALFVATAWFLIANIHPFLSLHAPAEDANILVIEGWVPDVTLEQHLSGFGVGEPYDYVFTTGSELPRGHYLVDFDNFAELTARTLIKLGIPPDRIITAPTAARNKDRTYHSALAFKQKFESSQIPAVRDAEAIDVLTRDIHGRRTYTIFNKLLGDDLEIGIISAEPGNYDTRRWFASSEGAKAVITETISLAYEWFGSKDR